ncbi:MAG: Hsp20/alpha crystallin family protein, partial [Smithella sp.]
MKVRNFLPEIARKTRTDVDYPFYSLQREMNSLFDNFFRGFDLAPRGLAVGVFSPSIDVKENDKEFILKAE